MSLNESQVKDALGKLVDPNTGKDFIATRAARNIKVSGADVTLEVELGYPGKSQHEPIRRQIIQALKAAGAANVAVNVGSKVVHQTMSSANGRDLETFEIITADGKTKQVCFDITSFYGKP